MLGGDQRRISMNNEPPVQSLHSRESIISGPSALKHVGQNSPCVVSRDDVQNGAHIQQADSIVNLSKKLQDDMQELGQKIKHHDDNVKYLKALKNKLEESILDMQVAIGKYYTRSSSTEKEDFAHMRSEEETIQNILKHEKSAAALLCWIKGQPVAQGSYRLLTKDVVGIVAMLGKVDDDNLSRLLSEYLGLDTMLAVVCRTYEGVTALEAYDREGLINKSLGLHALGASTGRPLNDRFVVICLEKLRPYCGEIIADDPQQRLDLQTPKLLNGEIPPGFLGFAVNMITIDCNNLNGFSNNGCSLRETLFYNLFTNLQVYRSREDMLKALSCITNGAISLDGGIIKGPAVFSLGQYREGNIDVMFPNGSDGLNLPGSYFEIESHMKETEWKKTRTLEDLQREQTLLDRARYNYEIKKREFVQFLAESSSFAAQTVNIRELRSWMYNRLLPNRKGWYPEFVKGVEEFINYASNLQQYSQDGGMRCPCSKCKNRKFLKSAETHLHILKYGFMADYYYWINHGECEPQNQQGATSSNVQQAVPRMHNTYE